MTPDIAELIGRLKKATSGSEALEAEIAAFRNNAIVKPYPPSDDFGPHDHWQFWSLDGLHFLGNESRAPFKLSPWTRSIDAASGLLSPGLIMRLSS